MPQNKKRKRKMLRKCNNNTLCNKCNKNIEAWCKALFQKSNQIKSNLFTIITYESTLPY